jgi:hypothetical protein
MRLATPKMATSATQPQLLFELIGMMFSHRRPSVKDLHCFYNKNTSLLSLTFNIVSFIGLIRSRQHLAFTRRQRAAEPPDCGC